MKFNQAAMDKARFEKKKISDLTVAEFRKVMAECIVADRAREQSRKALEDNLAYQMAIRNDVGAEQIRERLRAL
jgi:hypothetical protein